MRTKLWLAGLGLVAISACLLAGSATARSAAAPTITNFTPKQGVLGSKVTISGTNLAGATVMFNGTATAPAQVNRYGNSAVATIPNDPDLMPVGSKVQVSIKTSAGTASAQGTFLVTALGPGKVPGTPHITSFSPTKGKPGSKITVWGTNLGGAKLVALAGMKTIYTVPAQNRVVLTVPAHAHSGRVSVKTAAGLTASAGRFTVVASNL